MSLNFNISEISLPFDYLKNQPLIIFSLLLSFVGSSVRFITDVLIGCIGVGSIGVITVACMGMIPIKFPTGLITVLPTFSFNALNSILAEEYFLNFIFKIL